MADQQNTRVGASSVLPDPEKMQDRMQLKTQSKMLVATFLGGFTATALVELVKDSDKLRDQGGDPLTIAAIVSLTLALGLFVIAVYMYDFLGTPITYWRPPKGLSYRLRQLFQKKEYLIEDRSNFTADSVYREMKLTWAIVFTPAVMLAAIGFLLLVLRSGMILFILCAAALIAIFLYWRAVRSPYGVD